MLSQQLNLKDLFSKVNLFCLIQFESLPEDRILSVLTEDALRELKREIHEYLVNDLKFSDETFKISAEKQKNANFRFCQKCKSTCSILN